MGNCGTTPTDGANVFALKFKVIFRDSTQNIFFSKHPNKAEFNDMDDSEVLSSDFSGLRTSMASMTSTA